MTPLTSDSLPGLMAPFKLPPRHTLILSPKFWPIFLRVAGVTSAQICQHTITRSSWKPPIVKVQPVQVGAVGRSFMGGGEDNEAFVEELVQIINGIMCSSRVTQLPLVEIRKYGKLYTRGRDSTE